MQTEKPPLPCRVGLRRGGVGHVLGHAHDEAVVAPVAVRLTVAWVGPRRSGLVEHSLFPTRWNPLDV